AADPQEGLRTRAAAMPNEVQIETPGAVPVTAQTAARIAALWRIEAPRLIGALARKLRDLGEAEDLAQDALEQALRTWPEQGLPDNPAAWLMAVAQRRAIDALRARHLHAEKEAEFARDLETLGLDRVQPLVKDRSEID